MNRPWAALGLVLALCVIMPREASGQKPASGRPGMTQNYPNPLNPRTVQPFTVGGYPNCAEPNRQYRITLKVLNVLGQTVSFPVLVGGAGGVPGGTPLKGVLLTCNKYEALWDEKSFGNGREPASGVYIFVLDQDGVLISSKAIVSK